MPRSTRDAWLLKSFAVPSSAREDSIDKQLVARIQELGDRASAAELYRRCIPELRMAANCILRNSHDAEEAAHDAFERALRNLGCFDVGGSAPFRAWIRVIVRRRCLDLLRKGGDVEVVSLEAAEEMPDEPVEDRWHERSDGEWSTSSPLVAMLQGLPNSQHQVLALDCLGYGTREIASHLDRTPGAVRILRHRGLNTLREQLAIAA
jgi:RNA polymerase sigma-70 factor (ECF subfamily)